MAAGAARSIGLQLAIALIAGGLVGRALGAEAAPLGAFALLYVKVLKVLATPLVFVAIVDTMARTKVALRPLATLLTASTVNAIVACVIGVGLMNLLPLDRLIDGEAFRQAAAPSKVAPGAVELVIGRALDRLLIANILWVIVAAVVVGTMLRLRRISVSPKLLHGMMRVLGWVVRGVPLAAFGVVAKVVGTTGLALVGPLLVFVALVFVGIALHVVGWYSLVLRFWARRAPLAFLRKVSPALYTAFAGGSSLAALPMTLRVLEEDVGVHPSSARLAACLGTNLNHDGIILYEAMAALFVAHAFAVPLGAAAQLKVVAASVLAAVGIAGVPEAGLITLSLVLGAAGLPLAAVPLLLPVDWLLGRFRATANVASDLVVATLIDRSR